MRRFVGETDGEGGNGNGRRMDFCSRVGQIEKGAVFTVRTPTGADP